MSQDVKLPLDYYKHVSLFWTDLIHLMSGKPIALTSVGPMRNWANDMKKVVTEMMDANEDLVEFNQKLTEYYKQLSEAWIDAQKKVNAKVPDIPQDVESIEAYKRVWIDIFENDFVQDHLRVSIVGVVQRLVGFKHQIQFVYHIFRQFFDVELYRVVAYFSFF